MYLRKGACGRRVLGRCSPWGCRSRAAHSFAAPSAARKASRFSCDCSAAASVRSAARKRPGSSAADSHAARQRGTAPEALATASAAQDGALGFQAQGQSHEAEIFPSNCGTAAAEQAGRSSPYFGTQRQGGLSKGREKSGTQRGWRYQGHALDATSDWYDSLQHNFREAILAVGRTIKTGRVPPILDCVHAHARVLPKKRTYVSSSAQTIGLRSLSRVPIYQASLITLQGVLLLYSVTCSAFPDLPAMVSGRLAPSALRLRRSCSSAASRGAGTGAPPSGEGAAAAESAVCVSSAC